VSGLKRGDQDWECEHPSNFYGVHEAHGHFKIFARIGQITYHDADLTATFVCLGSFASVWPRTDDFRSTPINRHPYRARECRKCVTSVILVLNQCRCIGCSPGKHPDTRTMATGSGDDSRDSVHGRYLCIVV
jgi:hypothetical protein